MSPIAKIKAAFEAQDWSIVEEAYKELTGEDLKQPAKKSKVRGTKSNKVIVDEVPETVVKNIPLAKERDNDTFTSIRNKNQVVPPQKFVRDGKEHTMCGVEQLDLSKSKINLFEDDLSMENQLVGKPNKPVKKVSQTTREGYKEGLVEAQCKGCDRYFKVQREFASHYRCEGCMVRR